MFELCGPERAQENLLHQLAGHQDQNHRLEVDYLEIKGKVNIKWSVAYFVYSPPYWDWTW